MLPKTITTTLAIAASERHRFWRGWTGGGVGVLNMCVGVKERQRHEIAPALPAQHLSSIPDDAGTSHA